MILDAYGKAIRRNTLITPDWLMRETVRVLADAEADRRVRALRESIRVDASEGRVGETIHVRLPRRYAQSAPENGAGA